MSETGPTFSIIDSFSPSPSQIIIIIIITTTTSLVTTMSIILIIIVAFIIIPETGMDVVRRPMLGENMSIPMCVLVGNLLAKELKAPLETKAALRVTRTAESS